MKDHPIQNTNIITYPKSISTSFNLITPFTSPVLYIEKYVKSPTFKRELTKLANKFDRFSHLSFYTDGSVTRNEDNIHSKAAAAWIETSTVSPTEFSCGVNVDFISSTKAEIMAVLSAIIIAPKDCAIDIYTDSQNVIMTYNYINMNNILNYPKECFKTQYIDLWYALFDVILYNDLMLTFHKIKAHARNSNNNHVDLLTKDALDCEPMNINIINSIYNVTSKFYNTIITTL